MTDSSSSVAASGLTAAPELGTYQDKPIYTGAGGFYYSNGDGTTTLIGTDFVNDGGVSDEDQTPGSSSAARAGVGTGTPASASTRRTGALVEVE